MPISSHMRCSWSIISNLQKLFFLQPTLLPTSLTQSTKANHMVLMAPPTATIPPLNLQTIIMTTIKAEAVVGAPFLTHYLALILDYYVCFVDDFRKFTWLFLMAGK